MSHSHTQPSIEARAWAESERSTALLQQIVDLRHSNRRLVYANLELDQLMRAHAEQMLAETAQHEAARNQLQAEVNYYQAQSEHYQAEAQALWVENYELRVRLSALRHRVANRAAQLVKRVPGLERVLRMILSLKPRGPLRPGVATPGLWKAVNG
jgi:hypothetical protein